MKDKAEKDYSEKIIINLLKSRDEQGLLLLINKYGYMIKYIVAGILKDDRDIEESINDIYVKIWNNIDRFDETKGKLSVWVTVISKNTALDKLKLQVTEDELDEEYGLYSLSAEFIYLEKERIRELTELVSSMGRKQEDLFWRKYYYLQSTKQIAIELGMTERAVEGKLYRIKKKLQKLGGELMC